jgi:hypothetical protein
MTLSMAITSIFNIMTLKIATLSIPTFSIAALNITTRRKTKHSLTVTFSISSHSTMYF